jgi:hypothetical protein
MNDELENVLEGSGRDLIEIMFQHFSGGTEENRQTSIRINSLRLIFGPNITRLRVSNFTLCQPAGPE